MAYAGDHVAPEVGAPPSPDEVLRNFGYLLQLFIAIPADAQRPFRLRHCPTVASTSDSPSVGTRISTAIFPSPHCLGFNG